MTMIIIILVFPEIYNMNLSFNHIYILIYNNK
jgi:hypothetical protein